MKDKNPGMNQPIPAPPFKSPSPQVKPKGKKKPAFGNRKASVLIESISSFEKLSKCIRIVQKNGEELELDFNNDYLCAIAHKILRSHFNVVQPESYPCNVCKCGPRTNDGCNMREVLNLERHEYCNSFNKFVPPEGG